MTADTDRYRKNLRDELDGSALYAALADAETDPIRKDLFLQLSQAEAEHANVWRKKLTAAGINAEQFAPTFKTRILARLANRFGPRFVLPAIAAAEFADPFDRPTRRAGGVRANVENAVDRVAAEERRVDAGVDGPLYVRVHVERPVFVVRH